MKNVAIVLFALCMTTFWGCGAKSPINSSNSQIGDKAKDDQDNAQLPVATVEPVAAVVTPPLITPAPAPIPVPTFVPVGAWGNRGGGGHDHDDDNHHKCSLSLEKTANLSLVPGVGEVITYTYSVQNGPSPLNNVNINEISFSGAGQLSQLTCLPVQPADLRAHENLVCTASYIVQPEDQGRDLTNTALVSGNSRYCGYISDSALLTIPGQTIIPSISLTKTANREGFALTVLPPANVTITYEFVATNTGPQTLSNVTIADIPGSFSGAPPLAALTCVPAQPAVLAPGESLRCEVDYVVTQADIESGGLANVAETEGTSNGALVTDTASLTIAVGPDIILRKRAEDSNSNVLSVLPAAGTEITYILTAINSGSVTLTNVTIADIPVSFSGAPPLGPLTCVPAQPAILAPGVPLRCSVSYVVTQDDIDSGVLSNAGVVEGTSDGSIISAQVSLDLPAPEPVPAISLVKTAQTFGTALPIDELPLPGSLMVYVFTATNIGSVTLSNVSIADIPASFSGAPPLGALECLPAQPAILAPGEVLLCGVGYAVTVADFEVGPLFSNSAIAEGTYNGMTVISEDTLELPVALP